VQAPSSAGLTIVLLRAARLAKQAATPAKIAQLSTLVDEPLCIQHIWATMLPGQGKGEAVAYVITKLCIDCVDKGCVEVCPVECIYEPVPAETGLANMLYIHPTECISCGACEPECPWTAIFEDREVPALLTEDLAVNALCEEQPERFVVAQPTRDEQGRLVHKPRRTAADVVANRVKWGLPPVG
jgi:ferredoxin